MAAADPAGPGGTARPLAKKRRDPWLSLVAWVERVVLNLFIGLAVAMVGRRLERRFRRR